MKTPSRPLRLSVVIPARNEAENIGPLIDTIQAVCREAGAFEIIVVDDGATDDTAAIVRARMETMGNLRLIAHGRSFGQSAAIRTGVRAARAAVVCTLDGDGQNPPEDLPRLYGPYLEAQDGEGRVALLGLIAGQRSSRCDTWSKRTASRIANALRSRLLGDGTRDTGCGLKAFRREDYMLLPYFNHMHRFLPALFRREGFAVRHVDVGHRPRRGGVSHYSNLQRGLVGVVDLFGVMWLIRRGERAVPCEVTLTRAETADETVEAVETPRAMRA